MNKILCLVMGVMILGVGVVSASCDSADISIVSPTLNSYTKASTQLINWSLLNIGCNSYEFNLRYSIGDCTSVEYKIVDKAFTSGETQYNWDISSLGTGQYCVKVYRVGTLVKNEVSFTIDRTAPNITFNNAPYSVVKGNFAPISANISDESGLTKYVIKFNSTDTGKEVNLTSNPQTISEPYNYTTSGEYTITIIAYDKAGNTKTSTTTVLVNDKKPDWQIEFKAGKTNMFSIPLTPTSTAIASVLPKSVSDKANTIWSYQKGSWKYNTPTTTGWSTSSSRLQEIVPGYGYIIFMNSDAVAYGNSKALGQDVPPEVTLMTGWNLIGHYGMEPDISDTSAFWSLWLGNDDYWNSLLIVNGEGEFENVNKLDPTEAYWLSIKSLNLAEGEKRYFSYMPGPECY